MINPTLDIGYFREQLVARRCVQIPGFLQEAPARSILECLQRDGPWSLAYRANGESKIVHRDEYRSMSDVQVAGLLAEANMQAKGEYGFAYESYMMVKAYIEKQDQGLLLHRVLEYLNSAEFLDFARSVTGLRAIRRTNAQATRYRPGHFLRMHDDVDLSDGRLAAYVLNLTPGWHPDWGGLLHLQRDDGMISEILFPFWNTLSLFLVPQFHFVSGVMPYAEQDRLAITGWFQT